MDSLHSYRADKPDALAKVQAFVEDLRVHCRDLRIAALPGAEDEPDVPAKFVDVLGRQQTNAVDGGFYMIDTLMAYVVNPRAFRSIFYPNAGTPAEISLPVDVGAVRSACVDVLQEVA
jgi:hypothetical protein